jgi:DNA polymerase III epsilon subunit-like protein
MQCTTNILSNYYISYLTPILERRSPKKELLMPTLVAFDLETTGLDPKTDSIIEISAVRFNERRIEEEFSMLINPGKRIPKKSAGWFKKVIASNEI